MTSKIDDEGQATLLAQAKHFRELFDQTSGTLPVSTGDRPTSQEVQVFAQSLLRCQTADAVSKLIQGYPREAFQCTGVCIGIEKAEGRHFGLSRQLGHNGSPFGLLGACIALHAEDQIRAQP